MKNARRRVAALALSLSLAAGLCMNTYAYTYPKAYWPIHNAWETAVNAQDIQQTISLAQQTYDLLSKDPLCADICYNLEVKCKRAAWCCEIQGDLDGAITWLKRERTYAQWLTDNGVSYKDTLLNIEAQLNCLEAAQSTSIYILTDEEKAYPQSGAAASGTWYGSAVSGGNSPDCASLMYVTFGDEYSVEYWINYYRTQYPEFEKASTQGGVIELAWNFPTESTADSYTVLKSDAYIAESLAAMSRVNATILLRVGAEMNCWSDSDPAVFKQAFQKIAVMARQYSNIKLVFSPNYISSRDVTFEDYYPGDDYVDWIGVSSYHNSNYISQSATADYRYDAGEISNDAYYGTGLYGNDPLVTIRSLAAFADAHQKPMMISECGFSMTNPKTGNQQAEYAADQMRKFYSYVNMVYPQVKAVFYFDHNPGDKTQYALSDHAALQKVYQQAIRENGAYLSSSTDSGKTWVSLDAAGVQNGTIKLATYAIFPGKTNATVTYYVDGTEVSASSTAPYYFELDTSRLTPGTHTITATATAGQFHQTSQSYTLSVGNATGLPLYTASEWAIPNIKAAEEKGLITKRNRSDFKKTITRLEFAELAVNLIETVTGQTLPLSETVFDDTTDEIVRKAFYAGVTNGKGNNQFAPNDPITRQEICVMLHNVIRYVDQASGRTTLTNTSTQVDASRFQDTEQIAPWATSSVAALTNNGLMSGRENCIAPLDNTTTQEAITLLLSLSNQF